MSVPKLLEQKCLKNYLIRCCYHYYVLAAPLIRDREFDEEFKRLQRLERETGKADNDSPTQMIWGDVADQYPDRVKEGIDGL